MGDLAERLRRSFQPGVMKLLGEAADEIEHLQKENTKLKRDNWRLAGIVDNVRQAIDETDEPSSAEVVGDVVDDGKVVWRCDKS